MTLSVVLLLVPYFFSIKELKIEKMRNWLHNVRMNYLYEELGKIALGSKVRQLAEAITKDAGKIYSLYGIDMNPKWFPVFFVLSKDKNKKITSIAKLIGHSHVSVSKIVREMKKAGLIKEGTSETDKRQTLVSLTPSGKKIIRKIEKQYEDVHHVLEQISNQSQNDLWNAIEEWEGFLSEESLYDRVKAHKEGKLQQAVSIVPYQSKYQKAFQSLNEEWIEKYFRMEQPDRDALEHPNDYILKKGGYIFVALLGKKPVGVCALLKRKDKKYPYELAKMAVSPEAQGRQIGFLLGQAIITKAKELGAKKLYLESNTVLKPAISLYKKLGFKKIKGPQTPYERCNIQMELLLNR